MILPRTSDAAAKQILDSTRVFKEYARVRKESRQLKGSLFWKKVEPYEYLARKTQGKVTYIGQRNEETERQFQELRHKKEQVQHRARTLKESVESCQRMNKAVRAGAVPPPVVDVLTQLEVVGLSEGSVVLGASALFAYAQPAGVRVDEISSTTHGSVTEGTKHHLQVLLQASESTVKAALAELRAAADISVEITPSGGSGEQAYFLMECKFGRKRESSQCWADSSFWRAVAMKMPSALQQASNFEQIVIGKTGMMATMRTLDPRFFALFSHAVAQAPQSATAQDREAAERQATLVDSLIGDHLVVSKLPEAECRRRVDDIAQRVLAKE